MCQTRRSTKTALYLLAMRMEFQMLSIQFKKKVAQEPIVLARGITNILGASLRNVMIICLLEEATPRLEKEREAPFVPLIHRLLIFFQVNPAA